MRQLLIIAALLLCSSVARATDFTPTNSAQLVTALATAVGGDTISLTAGTTYTGPFTLRAGLTSTVTIRTANYGLGNDLRTTSPTGLATIECSLSNNQPCFATQGVAVNWRLTGMEIRQRSGITNATAMILIGSATETVIGNTPNNIEIDHNYIWSPTSGTSRSLWINGRNINIHDNTIIGARVAGFECQAILLGGGPGPVTIRNNHLQAMGEVVMSGGITTAILMGDLTFTRNYVEAPQKYNPWNPSVFDTTDAATTTALPCTLTSVGTVATCIGHGLPTPPSDAPIRVIKLTSGPQTGQQRTLYGASNANTFSLQAPFSVDQAGVTATVYGAWGHKNNFELKLLSGTTNTLEGNVFDGSWVLGQDGMGLVLTIRTENGAVPTGTIKNLTIQNNYFKRFNGFLRVISPDDFGGGTGVPMVNVALVGNVIEWGYEFSGPGTQAGVPTSAIRFILLNGPNATTHGTNVWFQHLTLRSALALNSYIIFTGNNAGDWVGFKLENSLVATQTDFGIFGDGGQSGLTVLNTWCGGLGNYSAVDNAFLNQNITNYPSGSFSESNVSGFGFNDVANSDYLLTSGLYRAGQARQASDGTARGADIGALSTAIGASSNAYATATIKAITGQWQGTVTIQGKVTLGGKTTP